MGVDHRHTANRGVLDKLRQGVSGGLELIGPDGLYDRHGIRAYDECGSHPGAVMRVWDELGAALPNGCCQVLYGTPVLLHDESGVVLAVCYGTSYAIRVPGGSLADA